MSSTINSNLNGAPQEPVVDANGNTLNSSSVIASNGTSIPVDSLAQTLAYNVDGTLNTITVSYLGLTYVQTFTYTSSKVTGISQWVKQ